MKRSTIYISMSLTLSFGLLLALLWLLGGDWTHLSMPAVLAADGNATGRNDAETIMGVDELVGSPGDENWTTFATGPDGGDINAITFDGAGNVYVGGAFITISDTTPTIPVTRTAMWNGSAWSALGSGLDGTVRAMASDSAGNVYAAGSFTGGVAMWDGSTWSVVGGGVVGTPNVRGLAVDDADNVYIGGTFTSTATCATGCAHLAKWDGSTWSSVGGGLGSTTSEAACRADALAYDSTSNSLYVGGQTECDRADPGGVSLTIRHVAKWNFTSSAWSALCDSAYPAPNCGLSGDAYRWAIDSTGNAYVAFGGSYAAGSNLTVNRIGKWDPTANSGAGGWTALCNGTECGSTTGGTGRGVVVDNADNVYLIVNRATVGGVTVNYIAKWNPNADAGAGAWSAMGSGLGNDDVRSLAYQDGFLYVGGGFTALGDSSATMRLARWTAADGKVVDGTGTYSFYPSAAAAPPALPVTVDVTTQGDLARINIQRYDKSHDNATGPISPDLNLATGYYWEIEGVNVSGGAASGFTASLTLPANGFTPDVNDRVCYYTGSGQVWDCAQSSHDGSSITRDGVTSFSDWAAGDDLGPPQISVSPDVLTSTQYVNQVITKPLTISNGGEMTLTFEVIESGALPVQGDLVAYYPFNGNANDESGNGNDGTVVGATLTTDRFGNPDSAYSFDGTDDCVAIDDTSDLDFLSGGFTLMAWVSFTHNYNNTIIGKHDCGSFNGYFLAIENDAASFHVSGGSNLQTPETYNDGSWHLIVGVYDGVNQYLYVDSALEASQPMSHDIPNDLDISIGRSREYCAYFNGVIDDVRIYGRALTEAEIQELYDWQGGGDVPWLSIEPVTGTVTTDGSTPIVVTFDATDLQPDTYTTEIVIQSNDPVTPTVSVPVTMTVLPTASMGWVEGAVTDATTGDPLTATVVALGQPYTITTNPDGTYKLWLDEGSYTLRAAAAGYVTETAAVSITAQQGITQNFDLVLNVPVLEVSPESLEVTHYVGDVTTRTLTITNSGPADLAFEVIESGALPVREGLVAYYPFNGNANDESGYGNDGTIEGATLAMDRFGNPSSAYSFDGLDDYIEMQSPLTLSEFAFSLWIKTQMSESINNDRIYTIDDGAGHYYALQGNSAGALSIVVDGGEVNEFDWAFEADAWTHIVVTFDGLNIQLYKDGVLTETGAISGSPITGTLVIGDPSSAWNGEIDDIHIYNRVLSEAEVQELYSWQGSSDVPWLSVAPISGTVTTDSSTPIDVTFDATGLQPDTYTTEIIIQSNDPVTPTVSVPVTMTVLPTASMGWVEGTVTDAATGDPLTATVVALGQPYTVTTNQDGTYKLWLDEGSYTLRAAAAGYVTETAAVSITAQQGITQNFDLVLNVPVLEVSPESLEVTHYVGDVTTRTLMITNSGPAPMDFEISGDPGISFFAASTDLYGYDVSDAWLRVVGTRDDTHVQVINLDTSAIIDENTDLDRYDIWDVYPSDGTFYKIEADKPVVGYETDLDGHDTFIPSLSSGPVGKEFIFYYHRDAYFYVFAVQPAVVKVYDTLGSLVISQTMSPGEYWDLSLSNAVYHITSTGHIAMETIGSDGYTTVPSIEGNGVGRRFYFATYEGASWHPGSFAVFAYQDTDVSVYDLDSSSLLYSQHINQGDNWWQTDVGTRRLRLESTGKVEVWAGSTQDGSGIENLGDDVSFAGGDRGREYYLHSLMDGSVIFAPFANTQVDVDGTVYTMNKDEYLHLSGCCYFRHIQSSQPILIQTLGRDSWWDNLGTYLGGRLMGGGGLPSWLVVDPITGTVPGYSSTLVQVTFDATGLQPDVYTAALIVQSNDPVTPTVSVPVTMTVLPATSVLSIGKVGPMEALSGEPITYTLTVTNSGMAPATGVVITDVLPSGAHYVSGGTLMPGDVVSWTVASLAAEGDTVQVQFVVTATQTITNSAYRVSCAEGVSATGEVPVVTDVRWHTIYLPLVLRNYP